MTLQRRHLESCLKELNIKGDVLDVGGLTWPVVNRTKSWDVSIYDILDINDKLIGRKAYYLEDLNKEIYEVGGYDIAFCLEVMQFIYNPFTAMKNLNRFLKVGGKLYINFHFFFDYKPMKGRDYLRYTKRAIAKLMKETGFKVDIVRALYQKKYDAETTFFVEATKWSKIPETIM